MNAFLIAIQFLTRFPVTIKTQWSDKKIAESLLWYPLVGALISLILIAFLGLLSNQPLMLVSALVLGLWVMISGGLHLDGLADSVDAWVGSHGDKQRALEIMKDPQAGPIAVITLFLLLLIKFAALYQLISDPDDATGMGPHAWLIIFPLVLSRSIPLLLFLTTPYVRKKGLGSAMANYLDKQSAWGILSLTTALTLFVLGFSIGVVHGVILIAVTLLFVWLLRLMMMKTLDGMTGDTIGAAIEIIEVVVLCTLVML